ncbi:putative Zn-dependent peptidase [Hyella patelloides LEGE 07179]|uniref:Putative Zn-dependent peptidase n=1 Tax=Hyella patelloides LEGE 07179 TaxID=945734 RepID=A0A563VQH7_9CYAN|nr:pitrilysin family protein [Hyella patelloides]VEP13661.1 putative Zn-dependent peptidase [Hyella patelloides LEGE 07179]
MVQVSTPLETPTLPVKVVQLSNGLTVIHQHISVTPVVVTDVWLGAGALAEPEPWSGMAHFLEHMIFKGSPQVEVGEFDWVIENTGGMANAATSHDYAHFYLATANTHLEQTLPYLSEILLHASIPDDEFIRERDVVLEEIRASNDDPDWLGLQLLYQTLYENHPYKRSILGEVELLMQHTPDLMRCFHRTHYQPENMTVAIVGGIDQESALSIVERTFNNFGVRSECPSFTIDAEPPLLSNRRQELKLPRIEQARLLMGWIGPSAENLEQGVGLDILSVILAEGRCSRLVDELREEKQLVLDICSTFSLQQDSSVFAISALLDTPDLYLVEKIICNHLWQLATEPISAKELARAKRLLINDYIFSTETPGQLASIYGYYNTINCLEQCLSYSATVERLTAEQLQRLAGAYLSPERYASVILKP